MCLWPPLQGLVRRIHIHQSQQFADDLATIPVDNSQTEEVEEANFGWIRHYNIIKILRWSNNLQRVCARASVHAHARILMKRNRTHAHCCKRWESIKRCLADALERIVGQDTNEKEDVSLDLLSILSLITVSSKFHSIVCVHIYIQQRTFQISQLMEYRVDSIHQYTWLVEMSLDSQGNSLQRNLLRFP